MRNNTFINIRVGLFKFFLKARFPNSGFKNNHEILVICALDYRLFFEHTENVITLKFES